MAILGNSFGLTTKNSVQKAVYQKITVTPSSPHIGAEIGNIDLTSPLSNLELSELKQAFTDYLVLFFRDQRISFEDQVRLANRPALGELRRGGKVLVVALQRPTINPGSDRIDFGLCEARVVFVGANAGVSAPGRHLS